MTKVLTFSTVFPKYHPKSGLPTYFVEKILKSLFTPGYLYKHGILVNSKIAPFVSGDNELFRKISQKHHTIRAGNNWKVGDTFSPRIWSGKPYNSKQIEIYTDITIIQLYDFEIRRGSYFINNLPSNDIVVEHVAKNDGLAYGELADWFQFPKDFKGQIICWNKDIKY